MATASISARPDVAPKSRYRPELQGLRALASGLVVVYHVWLGRISGGVDVFFLISGFLITGQLYRAGLRGPIAVRPFWGRVVRRLLPAAATVLLVTVAAGMVVLPEQRWLQAIREVVASALFVENWRLAADSVDYFAQHDAASVVQHFWSLSVQGQFYLVWPLLVGVVVLAARQTGQELRPLLAITLLALFAASLLYSVELTAANQPLAYFDSLTRVWEFALGGLLALGIDEIRLSRAVRVALGWIGVVGLVSCGLALDVGSQFPGYVALWPILSAAAVLVAGATGSRLGVDRALSSRPLRYLGDLSFALYLWHWPVLIFYLVGRDRAEVGWRGGLVIIGASLVLAALTYHLVEKPTRTAKLGARVLRGDYRVGALALVPVLLAAGTWHIVSTNTAEQVAVVGDDDHPGAMALEAGAGAGDDDAELIPSLVTLHEDFAGIDDCTPSALNDELKLCATPTAGPPTRRIVIVGDSHAEQYIAALRPIAEQRNWQLVAMLKGACPFSAVSDTVPGDRRCIAFNAAATQEIVRMHPDAVFTVGTLNVRRGLSEHTPQGFVDRWRSLDEAGIPVLAVRDNPRYDYAPAECLQRSGRGAPGCAPPREEFLAPQAPYTALRDVPPNVHFLDFSDHICPGTTCPPEIGNVFVYLDDNHLSATYLTSMSPIVGRAVVTAMGW
ncbi:acyltransferase family protein [Pseudonocardia acidicola]|uniref:Acyltransferase n=1 Tax=Pseudonocardia acidicola TaxID=2724939 RepID=A0ABX1SH30_9PSEU|nr:acyltransferase family protein [Pseudonocardia acidicola]NMH99574.1 acyltransferase [Pseudonocardia acidicola]